ncbi:MAG: SDR family oxidoreductase [Oscillospiraceae bacterium]|nr:SDR family oxidoreductase [Oscillospiraceae bacterium]
MTEPIKEFSLDVFSLKGKVAIITGGNTNLGLGYAVAFAKAGADLYIPHFTPDTAEAQRLIEAEGRRVKFIQGDLSDNGYVRNIVDDCLKEYGKIDILVNNAGTNHFEDVTTFPDEKFKQVTDINLNAVYYLGHEVAKVMIKQGGGKIVNIGSVLSFTADTMCPGYVVSKHGVIGITRYFANDLGKYNIQTNALCPGFIKTEINAALSDDTTFYDKITNRIPAGRWGSAEDLMGTAVFLASRASDYMNGWYLSVDGGFSTTL